MPKIPTQSRESQDDTLETLKPYKFHGLTISHRKGAKDATADCPFCGREGKLNINVNDSKFGCVICGESGNQFSFIRKLHESSLTHTSPTDRTQFHIDRKLLSEDTLVDWGVCKSIINGKWICPGYNEKGSINQLYQYIYTGERWAWLPTGGLNGHSLMGMGKYDAKKPITILCEGLWDGAALYEVLGMAKSSDQGYVKTGSYESSLLSDKNVLSFPAARVFKETWLPLFSGQTVFLMAQNDHPKLNEKTGTMSPPASYSGMERIAKLLLSAKNPPALINLLHWGEEGYDPELKSGYDLRDELISTGEALESRLTSLEGLERRIGPLPEKWILGAIKGSNGEGNNGYSEEQERSRLKTKPCTDYKTLITAWRKAMRWRQGMDDVLSTMLAVAASTVQVGDQLFLQVIGAAGGGKTKFCDAMLVSENCYPLEHLTGFHSGWKGSDGKDYSAITRMDRKTLITPEGDVIMSSPSFTQIMSEQRRIFDGTSGATFKNSDTDNRYTGLRTPWIMAGTPAMMDTDQSHLGDRFLKVLLDDPDEEERRDIIRRCGHAALGAVMQTSNGEAGKQLDPKYALAFQLTGGYVDYLRENVETLLSQLKVDADQLVEYCALLGEFTADMRARPDPEAYKKGDSKASKEMPTRLTHQFVRLACCLAIVLNKSVIDIEVLRRVKKVALDTSRGITLDIVKLIRKYELEGADGMEVITVHRYTDKSEEKSRIIMRFMRNIGLLRLSEPSAINGIKQKPKWYLTDRMRELYITIMEES